MLLFRPTGELLPADVMTSREMWRLIVRWRQSLAATLARAGLPEAAVFVLRQRKY